MSKLLIVLVTLAIVFAGIPESAAQLPADSLAVCGSTVGGTPGGIVQVGPLTAPGCQGITGFFCPHMDSLLYDPYAGYYLAGGLAGLPCPSNGFIFKILTSGTTATNQILFSVIPGTPAPVSDLALDHNGQYVAASGPNLWRVNRTTAVCAPINTTVFPGTVTAVAGSDVFYVAVSGSTPSIPTEIFQLDLSGGALQVGTTAGIIATPPHTITGLALGPDEESLWATGLGVPSLLKFDLSSGIPPFPGQGFLVTTQSLTAIEFKGSTAKLYATGGTFDSLLMVNPLFIFNPPTVIPCFPGTPSWGNSTGITVADNAGELFVFPRSVDVFGATSVTFEIALHGQPGNSGVVAITALQGLPFILPLGFGIFGADGRLALPPITVPLSSSMAGSDIALGAAELAPGGGLIIDFFATSVFLTAKAQTTKKLNSNTNDTLPKQIVLDVAPGQTAKVTNGGPDGVLGEFRLATSTTWTPAFVLFWGPTTTYSGQWSNSSNVGAFFRVSMTDTNPAAPHEEATISYNVD